MGNPNRIEALNHSKKTIEGEIKVGLTT